MEDVILYPAGGAFNKLRPKQTFLESLLQKNWAGYSTAPAHEKKAFVLDNIFNPIRASGRVLKIFKGKHPSGGRLVEPKEDEAYERLAQKLRDMKKRNTVRNPKRIYKKRKTSKSTSFDEYEDSDEWEEEEEEEDDETPVKELKEVIWGQREQIDSWRRLCRRQKATIHIQNEVIACQHQNLTRISAQGMPSFGIDGEGKKD